MGIESNTARFLLQARKRGVSFETTLTLGRQNLFVEQGLKGLEHDFGFSAANWGQKYSAKELEYAEPFFREALGAKKITSVDASSYEAATLIHDMNHPLPESLNNSCSAVVDAGSLEHILNFPVAIRSLMKVVKPGGSLFIQTPANNYFGHGFYQFSAELFYRIFNAENGFRVRRMVVFEHFFPSHFFPAPWYEVNDPDEVRSRVQLITKRPVLLMLEAEKLADKPIFEKFPQQSDYVQVWEGNTALATQPKSLLHRIKKKALGIPLWATGSLFLQYFVNGSNQPALKNRKFFKRVK